MSVSQPFPGVESTQSMLGDKTYNKIPAGQIRGMKLGRSVRDIFYYIHAFAYCEVANAVFTRSKCKYYSKDRTLPEVCNISSKDVHIQHASLVS